MSNRRSNDEAGKQLSAQPAGATGDGDLGVVWVVTKTYGMTYEGDTEVKGVYSSPEAAQAALERVGGSWDAEITEWRLDELPGQED